jgi:opacity protein-like surface antigen
MLSIMNIKPTYLHLLAIFLLGSMDVHAQSENFFEKEKPVLSYYENLDDKTYFHQRRIHGMKGELNDYSQKLHNLQQRFDQIFYGLAANHSFKTPFDVSNQPVRPSFANRLEGNLTSGQSVSVPSNDFSRVPREAEATPSSGPNQLAFNVDSPGESKNGNQVGSSFIPSNSGSRGLGAYLILTPAVVMPSKTHEGVDFKRKYDPGFAVSLASGIKKNGFRLGLGALYKRNDFDSSSRDKSGKPLTQDSETFSVYLDLGYEFALVGSLDGYLGLGLGYYRSYVEDPLERSEDGFLASGAIGLAYNFSDLVALRLGYRYFHEDEVPAHLAELGLGFEF